MSVQELVVLTDINPLLLKQLLEDLQDIYASKGISVINQNEMWKMDVAPEYATLVNKLATGSSVFTSAEQETLAIIAYKHPMKQSVLIKIRGNKAYDHVKKFVSMGLIVKKRMGHTSELKLSETFYEYFHAPEPEVK
jgi:segregation and condensation protein B